MCAVGSGLEAIASRLAATPISFLLLLEIGGRRYIQPVESG